MSVWSQGKPCAAPVQSGTWCTAPASWPTGIGTGVKSGSRLRKAEWGRQSAHLNKVNCINKPVDRQLLHQAPDRPRYDMNQCRTEQCTEFKVCYIQQRELPQYVRKSVHCFEQLQYSSLKFAESFVFNVVFRGVGLDNYFESFSYGSLNYNCTFYLVCPARYCANLLYIVVFKGTVPRKKCVRLWLGMSVFV
jgi:hypothetical protein